MNWWSGETFRIPKRGTPEYQEDYGPYRGVDYARFADDPDVAADGNLKDELVHLLKREFKHDVQQMQLKVRNGFVIVKGQLPDSETKEAVFHLIRTHQRVREIISDIEVLMTERKNDHDESKVEFGYGNGPAEKIPSDPTHFPDQKGSPGGNESVGMPGKNPRVRPEEDQRSQQQ